MFRKSCLTSLIPLGMRPKTRQYATNRGIGPHQAMLTDHMPHAIKPMKPVTKNIETNAGI